MTHAPLPRNRLGSDIERNRAKKFARGRRQNSLLEGEALATYVLLFQRMLHRVVVIGGHCLERDADVGLGRAVCGHAEPLGLALRAKRERSADALLRGRE